MSNQNKEYIKKYKHNTNDCNSIINGEKLL